MKLDEIDRRILERLQDGLPICERPYMAAADALNLSEAKLIARLRRLLRERVLSRFGPVYDGDRFGGVTVLAAMAVPEADYEAIATLVNAQPEIVRNSRREHRFNMWLVGAADTPRRVEAAFVRIERATGLTLLRLDKEREYGGHLRPPP